MHARGGACVLSSPIMLATPQIDALGAEEAREARRQLQLSREALDASTASMDDKVRDALQHPCVDPLSAGCTLATG